MNTIICPHCKKEIVFVQYELNKIILGHLDLTSKQQTEIKSHQPEPTKYYCPECEEEINKKLIK